MKIQSQGSIGGCRSAVMALPSPLTGDLLSVAAPFAYVHNGMHYVIV
jgi:hypothetical protein